MTYVKNKIFPSLVNTDIRDSFTTSSLTQIFGSIVRIHQGKWFPLFHGILLPRIQNRLANWFDLCWGQHLRKEVKRQKSNQDLFSSENGFSCLKRPSAYPPNPFLRCKLNQPYLAFNLWFSPCCRLSAPFRKFAALTGNTHLYCYRLL